MIAPLRVRFKLDLSQQFCLDVDLKLPAHGITAIFGASGSGKTSLLRCIAGLQQAPGELSLGGATWQSDRVCLPVHKRPIGYVFQESNLFAHLTAQKNLAYALKRAGNPHMHERYDAVVELLGIGAILHQYPEQLSGGERQRVAIARALLIDPRLLLMDEPLASLDEQRKSEVIPYLEALRKHFDLPILYVSHSLDEIARLADYLVVLERGQVSAEGPIAEVLSRIDLPLPVGEDAGVVLKATIAERDLHWNLTRIDFAGGELWLRDAGDAVGDEIRIRILARDVSLALSCHADSSILNRLPAKVVAMAADADAAMMLVQLQLGHTVALARVTRRSVEHLQLREGLGVWAQFKSVAVVR